MSNCANCETKPFAIQPDEWEVEEGVYHYFNDELKMHVQLEKTVPVYAHSNEQERLMFPAGWQLKADSNSLYDQDTEYYYDALSDDECASPCLSIAATSFFFDEEGNLKPVVLPEWLIDTMRFFVDEDAEASRNFHEWAKERQDETFDNRDVMLHNAWRWYAERHVNGGQYPDNAVMMLRAGEYEGLLECFSGSPSEYWSSPWAVKKAA